MIPADAWPLTGRERELASLQRRLVPGAAGAIVAGELGVGKSRLAAAFAEGLEAQGWVVSRHVATEARAAVPFSTFAGLLDDRRPPSDPLERVREAAGRLIDSERVVLLVDDAQWLDPESLAFVRHVAESAGATTLLTLRTGSPGADDVAGMARRAGLHRLDLRPLTEHEVDTLLRAVAPDSPAARRRELWELTQGNPLYLSQLVGQARDDDRASGLDPGPLVEIVGDCLAGLGDAAQDVLEWIVVAGVLDLDVLSHLGDAAAVADLEQRGLVEVAESGGRRVVRAGHPVYSEVLGAQMGPAVRRLRRRELLEALSRWPSRRRSDQVALAVWAVESGMAIDPSVLIAAAEHLIAIEHQELPDAQALAAVRVNRPVVAATLARAAVEAGGGFAAAACWFEIEAHLDGTSAATADALVRMGEEAVDEHDRVRALSAAASLHALNGWEEASSTFDELQAVRELTSEVAAQRHVDAALVFALALFGRAGAAVDLALDALADPETAPGDRLLLAGPLVGALAETGRPLSALERSHEAFGSLPADPDPWSLGALVYTHVVALVMAGRLQEGVTVVDQVLATIDPGGGDGRTTLFGSLRGDVALMCGRPGDALEAAREALERDGREHSDVRSGQVGHAHAVVAMAHALRGAAGPAAEAMARADECRHSMSIFRAFAGRARAWTAVAEGRLRTGVEMLREDLDGFGENRDGEMWCRYDLARLGQRGSGTAMRALLDDGVEGEFWTACTAHAEAFDAGDGAALDRAAGALAGLGAVLYAAEAAAQAADAHAGSGRRQAAAASRAQSDEWAAGCQGASTPALNGASRAHPQLTPRELEVARLAAGGASNRAIADALGLSVRTVESYVYRVCFKLGVASRVELADHPDL